LPIFFLKKKNRKDFGGWFPLNTPEITSRFTIIHEKKWGFKRGLVPFYPVLSSFIPFISEKDSHYLGAHGAVHFSRRRLHYCF
jgi:hypothetical protein